MVPSARTFIVVSLVTVTLVGVSAGTGPSPQQQTFSGVPQFVPGAVTVTGSVSIDNSPTVTAQQAGVWQVSLAEPPVVYWRSPAFLEIGRFYRFTSTNATATYRIVEFSPPDNAARTSGESTS